MARCLKQTQEISAFSSLSVKYQCPLRAWVQLEISPSTLTSRNSPDSSLWIAEVISATVYVRGLPRRERRITTCPS